MTCRIAEPIMSPLFERDDIAAIHAHNAAHGCFSARIFQC
ncbi:MAG: DUF1203 domain-containing protein [Sphingobium sp.]|nr:DUF1203 domain-containing protein [Sphingobium sp.]MCP5397952.1 DUF1203 domain-containing protein [Sphingomonas sp.]